MNKFLNQFKRAMWRKMNNCAGTVTFHVDQPKEMPDGVIDATLPPMRIEILYESNIRRKRSGQRKAS